MHQLTELEIRKLCVDSFEESKTRGKLMDVLSQACDKLGSVKICGDLWIDGSFMTKKIAPSDLDLLLVVPAHLLNASSPEMRDVLDWFESETTHRAIGLHGVVVPQFSKSSPMWALWNRDKTYWEKKFGTGHDDSTPKGVAVIKINGGA